MPQPAAESPRMNLRQRARRRRTAVASGLGCLGVLFQAFRLVVIVAAGIAGGRYVYQNFLGPMVMDQGGAAETDKPPVSSGPKPAEPSGLDHQLRERQLILAKVEQQQVLDLGILVNEAALEWGAELERWDSVKTALLKNESGKALATSTEYVKRFRAVYDAERPGRGEAERLKALAEELVSAVRTARASPDDGWQPPGEVTAKLQGLLRRAKEARDGYRLAREQIETLASKAKASGIVGTKPLYLAVKDQAEQEHDLETHLIAAKVREAQAEATRRRGDAEADRARESGRKQAEAFRAETTRLAAEKERARISRDAANPAIQAQFAPFLTDGNYQYNLGAFGAIRGPASYRTLEHNGHLKDVTAFAHAMAGHSFFGSGIYRVENDRRPLWALPTNQAGMRQMEQLLAQFKELAPTWIEMGKLKP